MFTKQICSTIAQELLQRSLDMLMLTSDKTMLQQRSPSKVYQTKLSSNCSRAPAKESGYAHAYKQQNHAPPEKPMKLLPNKAV